jgi:4-amino-4-deoxy-L-arabinose transferase-like glycosyltransferase
MAVKARRVVLTVLLLAYAGFLHHHARTYASGSDSSGYLNSARLMAAGRLTDPVRALPGVAMERYPTRDFTPLGFQPGPRRGEMAPTYPPGLPLHLVMASWLVGLDRAGALVNAVAGAFLLLLAYRLGRRLCLPPWWAAGATALLASCPLTIHFFTWLMSDGLAAAWCTAAVLLALRAGERPWSAAWAGLAFGVAVLVRPTDVLLLPALVVALPFRGRAWFRVFLGAVAPLIVLAVYQWALYGAPARTGYGDVSSLLRAAYFWPRLVHFATWLSRFLTPIVPVLWLGLALRASHGERRHLLLLAWGLPYVLFYAFYRPSIETWWYLRFLLPALPAFVLGAAAIARDVTVWTRRSRHGSWASRLAATAALSVLAWGVAASVSWTRHFRVTRIAANEVIYPRSAAWMESRVESGAPIACMQTSGALLYYSQHPLLRYDRVAPADLRAMAQAARSRGVGLYALLFELEVPEVERRFPGAFTEVGRLERASLWRYVGP